MQENPFDWRALLETIRERARPENLVRELGQMIEYLDDDEDLGIITLGGFGAEFLVISAGMAAMYVLSPEDPSEALASVERALIELDFETGIETLSREEQRMVRKYASMVKPVYANFARVVTAIFGAYVRGEYALSQDPNALIRQAESHMPMEPQAALQVLGRAGALALRGKPWWWRWDLEIAPPLGQWIGLADNVIQLTVSENGAPLDVPEQQRERWHQVTARAVEESVALDESETDADAADVPIDVDALFDQEEDEDDELEDLLDELFLGESELSKKLVAQFQAKRDDAIPHLIEIAQDEELWPEDSDGEGWASIHAVNLLGELRAAEAVQTLIDIVALSDPGEILHDRAILALEAIGTPAGRAVLETIWYTRNVELKRTLSYTLGKVGRDEPEAFDTLARLYDELSWEEARLLVALGLAELGDPRAIPILERAWRDPKLPEYEATDVAEALRQFGVEPTPPRKPGARYNPLPMRSHSMQLGRNDPCWCGSGRKYKHCHLGEDERGAKH